MQWLAAICVRRPVFTWVLILALVVFGGASLGGLGVDRFPNVSFPMVIVTTVLRGAAPEQVETEVSDKLEESLNSISGLEELRSNSYEGLSVVTAQFELEKDVAVAAQEVRDRVNRTLSQLPRDIDQPRVETIDPDAAPVIQVALQAPRSMREVAEYATRTLRRQLESLSGVGGVTVLGGRARQIQIIVDAGRLQGQGLTVADVQRALATQNVEVPGGDLNLGQRAVPVRVQGRVLDLREFAELAVAQRGGQTVHVRDVAQVIDGEEEASSSASISGKDVVILAVRKQSGTNTVAVANGLRERIGELQKTLPAGFKMTIVRDESVFIRNAVHTVQEHLIIGSLFAALVVLLFLWNGWSTLISALAIPTSIIATFALIKLMGLTLNVITLLALTLAVGIVIDDAIVVLENIIRFIDKKGMEPRRAAILATREIGLAVLATTLSLVAVFLPVAFMGGIVGRFLKSFGLTMSFAIMVSLLVSFTLTPMLSARWLKRRADAPVAPAEEEREEDQFAELADPAPEPRSVERARFAQWAKGTPADAPESEHGGGGHGGPMAWIERQYLRLLAVSMRHRWAVAIALVLSMGMGVPLFKVVQKNFLPLDDESRFEVTVRAPEGTSLPQTRILTERLATQIREIDGVEASVLTVGSPPGDPSGRGPNQAVLFISLRDPTKRKLDQQQIMDRVRRDVLPRFEKERLRVLVAPVNAFGGGGSDNAGIQYVMRGPDLNKLADYSQRLLEKVRTIPGVVDADSTLITGRPEFVVRIDRARAADLNVNVADISNAVRMLIGGVEVGNYNEGGEQYEVHLRAGDNLRDRPEALRQITVPAGPGRSARLDDLVSIREELGPASIRRLARQRQVTVYANVTPGTSEAAVIERFESARAELGMGPGYAASLAGRSKELKRTGQSFLFAIFLSLVFMYLVLAAQFESWIHPVTILVSLPLTVPFAVLSLVVLGQSLNLFSSLGILVLFGVVKKNSILQVDHMRDLRRRGLTRADAVMVGNRDRLRPILMTTIAFVAGMIPMVVSSGAGAGTNRAMGSVIIGGQTLSLLLTLIATPVVYSWLDDASHSNRMGRAGRWLRRAVFSLRPAVAPSPAPGGDLP